MNRLFGFYSFRSKINEELIESTQYKSPFWHPDHQGSYVEKNILLTTCQRFITPECSKILMPYYDLKSGYIILTDTFLTQRERLCRQLHTSIQFADADLILLAYKKWGTELTKYLSGEYCFAIWNPKDSLLFLATDPFSKRSIFYSYKPGDFFAFANECSPFGKLGLDLKLNDNMFAHFALDSLPSGETCFKNILKLQPGHQLQITPKGIKIECYWRLQDQTHSLGYRTREDYYQAFGALFEETIKDYLRTPYPVAAHISGGLDSSSVAAQAASLLAKKSLPLYGFTAIPKELEGPSYRPNWYYHEMPRVQALLEMYSNIQHYIYRSTPEENILQTLEHFFPFIDQPFRNISNFEWVISGLKYAHRQNARIMLTGDRGNGSISWGGYTWRKRASQYKRAIKILMNPTSAFNNLFINCQSDFLQSSQAKAILRTRAAHFSLRDFLLSAKIVSRRHSSIYPVYLYHGVVQLDPTHDLALIKFCYNTPNWVYCDGSEVLRQRLLVRKGLAHLLPDAIINNPFRGEQAADWFLQYNQHALSWYSQLQQVKPEVDNILHQYYDKQKFKSIQKKFSLPLIVGNESQKNIAIIMMRYLSVAFFLNYLEISYGVMNE